MADPTPADPGAVPAGPEETYKTYTVDRYTHAVKRLVELKGTYLACIVVATALSTFLVYEAPFPTSPFTEVLHWLTIVWILPVPILVIANVCYFLWLDRETLRLDPPAPSSAKTSTVVFTVTSTGREVETLYNTVRSVRYWTLRHPEVSFTTQIWAVIEVPGYDANRDRFDSMRAEGVEVVVVPKEYRTPQGTEHKGRALDYATRLRRASFPDLTRVWVYHQDDETAVGEDTILGIEEFVRTHAGHPAVGCGVILYDQHFSPRASQVQELSRTEYNLRVISSLVRTNNPLGGFHGSHYIVRADVEDRTGWDVGGGIITEDLVFELRLRRDHGGIFHVLKGFSHEQAPLKLHDQLRQRRRWVQGMLQNYLHYPFRWSRRVTLTYSLGMWLLAIVTLPLLVLLPLLHVGLIFEYQAVLTGFVWVTMVSKYHQGWVLHREYVAGPLPLFRIVAAGFVGSLADAVAPWYAVGSKWRGGFEVIQKDTVRSDRAHPSGPYGQTP